MFRRSVPSEEERRHGFHTSQLIDYTLEPNPDAGDDKDAPPLKLAIAFSTADVVRRLTITVSTARLTPSRRTVYTDRAFIVGRTRS